MPHLVMRERVQMATSFASSANDEGILELDLNHEGILELDFFLGGWWWWWVVLVLLTLGGFLFRVGGHQGGGDNP